MIENEETIESEEEDDGWKGEGEKDRTGKPENGSC